MTDNLVADGSVFLDDCNVTMNPKVVASYALDATNAERCWQLSERYIGQRSAV